MHIIVNILSEPVKLVHQIELNSLKTVRVSNTY